MLLLTADLNDRLPVFDDRLRILMNVNFYAEMMVFDLLQRAAAREDSLFIQRYKLQDTK